MSAPTKPVSVRVTRSRMPVQVFAWADASALQNLVQGSLLPPPHWVAVVPSHRERPSWIPRTAQPHTLPEHETAYTWRDEESR